MEIGSIVICVDDSISIHATAPYQSPVKGNLYTIREIVKINGSTGIRLCEFICRNTIGGSLEICFNINRFEEVLPPMDIAAVIEKECELVLSN